MPFCRCRLRLVLPHAGRGLLPMCCGEEGWHHWLMRTIDTVASVTLAMLVVIAAAVALLMIVTYDPATVAVIMALVTYGFWQLHRN